MSTFALRALRHGRALMLAMVVVALISVTLLVWAMTGGSTGPSGALSPGGSDPRGAVTDAGVNPWEANSPSDSPGPVADAGVNPWAANDPALVAR